MSFDPVKRDTPAAQYHVADVAIDTTVALYAVSQALQRIAEKTNVDISEFVEEIRELAASLSKKFDDLTGYVPDADDGD